jgi:cytoskeletal protein RodZ
MKKKTQKKLELAKETVRALEAGKLQEIHGGACLSRGYLSCGSQYCTTNDVNC